jgi:4-aminobutyrate aminotransferase-like enzyme
LNVHKPELSVSERLTSVAVLGGASSRALREREARVLAAAGFVEPTPCWESARGTWIRDVDGRELLDFTSGVLVIAAGHGHPRITAAIVAQAQQLVNSYAAPNPLRSQLAEEILRIAGEPFERVVFVTSGSEAIDAALKVARCATGRAGIVAFSGAFHGRTMAGISVGGLESLRTDVGSPLPHVIHSPYPYPYRWELGEPVDETGAEAVGAILVEPFLGAGGCIPASPGFLAGLRALADEIGALLIFDEIQSGLGRCGEWFSFHALKVRPDIFVGSKALGGGLPITAVVSRADIFECVPRGSMTSTFGGNPLACAAALATLAVIDEEGLVENAARVSADMMEQLGTWVGTVPFVGEARASGLSFGLELVGDSVTKEPVADVARRVVEVAWDHGLAVLPSAGALGNVVRFAPPLCMSSTEALEGLHRLRRALLHVAEIV